MRTCSSEGCNRKVLARGLCGRHYQQDRTARLAKPKPPTQADWLLAAIAVVTDECVMWPFHRNKQNGRGYVAFGGKRREASRLTCELTHGVPPTPKHEAAHSCGKGHLGCINPEHLRWATKPENEADKVVHGTSNRGERSATAKLNEAQALEIRRSASHVPHRLMAKQFGVSRATIGDVARAKSWKHI